MSRAHAQEGRKSSAHFLNFVKHFKTLVAELSEPHIVNLLGHRLLAIIFEVDETSCVGGG
jgi:hypothetical protein